MANQIFIPELLEAGIVAKLGNQIKLYPISLVKDLGNHQGGDRITVPKTNYVGDASTVVAGAMIPVSDFVQSSTDVVVSKYAKSVSFTEEDLNNAFIDVQASAEDQLAKSVASGLENQMFASLRGITGAMLHASTATSLSTTIIGDALVKFGEDVDGEKYLLVNPTEFANLRKDPNFVVKSNDKLDSVGEIYGCTVVVSSRVNAKEAFIVKPEAVAMYLRQDVKVEYQKEIANQTHLLVATAHAGIHLRDDQKAIKITIA